MTRFNFFSKQFLTDFLDLIKFKILFFSLLTVGVGAILASSSIDIDFFYTFSFLILGTTLVFSSASALNHAIEVNTDQLMVRTQNRPLVSKRFNFLFVILFSVFSFVLGSLILFYKVNSIVFFLCFFILISYDFFYTPLKKITWMNTFIGAVPGAMPVLCGWFAFSYDVSLLIVFLFLIFFFWQLPHFFSIAWIQRDAYEHAKIKMISEGDISGRKTATAIIISTIIFVIITLLPIYFNLFSFVFFLVMLGVGLFFIYISFMFFKNRSIYSARLVLRFSLIYPPIILLLTLF